MAVTVETANRTAIEVSNPRGLYYRFGHPGGPPDGQRALVGSMFHRGCGAVKLRQTSLTVMVIVRFRLRCYNYLAMGTLYTKWYTWYNHWFLYPQPFLLPSP